MEQRRVGRGLLLLIATSFFQHAASQDAGDGSPRLVRITDSVFRTVHRPGATNSVVVVIPGHAEPTTQQGFLDFRDYVVALRDRVLNEMVRGASIEQIIGRVTVDDFADYLNMASWRRTNIISMWDTMYRWREPNCDDSPGNYQSLCPIGNSLGEFGLPE